MGFVSCLQPRVQQAAHPDDIFLWPDDVHFTRREWERGEISDRSDDFIVVPVDSIHYDSISQEHMGYDDYCRNLSAKPKAREPWMLNDDEIDQAIAPGPARSRAISEMTPQEIKALTRMEFKVPVHPEIDRTEVQAIAAEQKQSGLAIRGPVVTVQTQGYPGPGSPRRIRLNLPARRSGGLER